MSALPTEIQAIADLVADEPEAFRQNFIYILCTMLVENEQMALAADAEEGDFLQLQFKEERFNIHRATLDEDMEEMLRAEIGSFLKERGGIG